jgi:Replication-relaxation
MVRAERNNLRAPVWILDERDHAILRSLLEHKVLTTDQIKSLYFRSLRRCQHRLKELRDLGLIPSFTARRGFGEGRPPGCLFLTKLGMSACAESKGVRASDLSWIPDGGYRSSRNLAHRLGVNAFFCALVEASRAHEGHCLVTWRPERWVRTRAAELKPDGFGRYLHPGGACEFYLEYDRGTEAFWGALAETRGLPPARGGVDRGPESQRPSEPPSHRSGVDARGGGWLGPSSRDRTPSYSCVPGDVVPPIRCERGTAV